MSLEIFFRTINQKIFSLRFFANDPILKVAASVCKEIQSETAVKLVHAGRVLDENLVLSTYQGEIATGVVIVVPVKGTNPQQFFDTDIQVKPINSENEVSPISSPVDSKNNEASIVSDETDQSFCSSPTYNEDESSQLDALVHEKFQQNGGGLVDKLAKFLSENPETFSQLLEDLIEINPELVENLKKGPDELERALLEYNVLSDYDDEMLQENEQISDSIPITDEERKSIERLMALGFSEALVLKIYILCHKNENDAAEVLLSQFEPDAKKL